MKLHKDCKIELASSTDKGRAPLLEPYLEIDKDGHGSLVAVDGRILARIPVDLSEGDSPGFVGADCLKAARKASGRLGTTEVRLNGKASVGELTMPREGKASGEFPSKWREICVQPEGDVVAVAINAELLWKLAQAMGTRGIVLRFNRDGLSALHVRPTTTGYGVAEERAEGWIMPLRMS